jgi:hypothetical protein
LTCSRKHIDLMSNETFGLAIECLCLHWQYTSKIRSFEPARSTKYLLHRGARHRMTMSRG